MDIQNIFSNGLPQELKNLQDGQIYLFPKFGEGLSEKNILISQYINAAYKKIIELTKGSKKKAAVFAIPTENQALWDCIACRITTSNGEVIEVADSGSLLEMLFDYYGVDYANASKVKMSDRHKIVPANYPPERIPIDSIKVPSDVEDIDYDWFSPAFSCLVDKSFSKDEIRKNVLTSLFDAEYNKEKYGVDYSIEEILRDFQSEKEKSYRLAIIPEKVEVPKTKDDIRTFIDCHIYLINEKDERTELVMKAQEKAVYLLFLLHKEGISIKDFPTERKKNFADYKNKYRNLLSLYTVLQRKLFNNNEIENPQLLQGDIRPIINKIRNKISDITQNKKYIEKFAVEGYVGKPFKVEAATDEQRYSIIEVFDIDEQKYELK